MLFPRRVPARGGSSEAEILKLPDGASAHLEAIGIWKRYGGAVALRDVSLRIEPGKIHAIVGEIGAGKSTFGKVLSGVTAPASGELRVRGEPVHFRSPRHALDRGIALVHQEISLVPQLTVLENVLLGAERRTAGVLRKRELRMRFDELLDQTGFDLEPDRLVGTLPPATQQKVEIVRAIGRGASAIVFDEPTAPLTIDESEALYRILRGLREQGTTIVYVSHYLEEVLALADTVSVFRNGEHVQTTPAAEATIDSLILAMLGRTLEATFPPKRRPAPSRPQLLEVRHASRGNVVKAASLTIGAGEIVGLAGLVGSGRTELARLIYGADRMDSGEVRLGGQTVRIRTPRDGIDQGIAYVPESRKDQGMVATRSVRENMTLPSLGDLSRGGVIRAKNELRLTQAMIERVELRPAEPERGIATLSGGNQQKIVFARWLMRKPRLLIADEPTRGVDVGAKQALYSLLTEIAEQGTAVLLISSELEEITGLSHRIYVMRQGELVAEVDGDTQADLILAAAFGGIDAAEEEEHES